MEARHASVKPTMQAWPRMRELNHPSLVKRARVLCDIRRRRGRTNDVRKPRPIGRTRNSASPLAHEARQPRQPSKQTSFEYATEGSQTLFQEVHLVLDN